MPPPPLLRDPPCSPPAGEGRGSVGFGFPPPLAGEGQGGGRRLRSRCRDRDMPDPVLRLAALVDVDRAGAMRLAERLRLSNAMRDRLAGLAPPWTLDPAGDRKEQRRALYRLGRERYRDLALLLAADGRLDREVLARLLACAAAWDMPQFPIAGRDVTAKGIPPGPRDRPTARRRARLVGRGRFQRRPRRLPRAARRADRAGAGLLQVATALLTTMTPASSLGAMVSRRPHHDRRCRRNGGTGAVWAFGRRRGSANPR